jgi:hypothetical protein
MTMAQSSPNYALKSLIERYIQNPAAFAAFSSDNEYKSPSSEPQAKSQSQSLSQSQSPNSSPKQSKPQTNSHEDEFAHILELSKKERGPPVDFCTSEAFSDQIQRAIELSSQEIANERLFGLGWNRVQQLLELNERIEIAKACAISIREQGPPI